MNAGLPAPEQDAGMATATGFVVGAGTTLVTIVDGAAGAAGAVSRLVLTSESKLSMRAAPRSWVHLPHAWWTLKAESFRVESSTWETPYAQANCVVPVPLSACRVSSLFCHPVHPLHSALTVQCVLFVVVPLRYVCSAPSYPSGSPIELHIVSKDIAGMFWFTYKANRAEIVPDFPFGQATLSGFQTMFPPQEKPAQVFAIGAVILMTAS